MRASGVSAAGQAGPRGPRRDERWLAGVWDKQSFERRQLRTTLGLAFKVVFPGMCTGGAGPDFRDAILALPDGSLLRGDVELHLESSGWRQHGHHRDSAYDRVLLHVVLEDDVPARNSRGEPVLTLELAGRLKPRSLDPGRAAPRAELLGRAQTADAAATAPPPRLPGAGLAAEPPQGQRALTISEPGSLPFSLHAPNGSFGPTRGHTALVPQPGMAVVEPAGLARVAVRQDQLSYVVAPCQQALPRQEPGAVGALLAKLALERFQAKQGVTEGELAVFEPEQVLYAGLLEALGYSRNQAPFRRLGQLVPLPALLCARTEDSIRELLLEAAGLAHGDEGRLAAAGLLGQPLAAAEWRVVGVRPDNLPARRVEQFAAVLARGLPGGLVDELLAPLLESYAESCADGSYAGGESGSGEEALARRLRGVWQEQLAAVGRQRADAMAINVLLPFAAAYGQATCQFMLSEAAVRAFLAYPAEGANQVTSYMRRDILRSLASVARGAAGEQGLLHVWDRWCHHKVCALCPLGSRGGQSSHSP